jgi:tetratricopeptide (TPR) repeat protein
MGKRDYTLRENGTDPTMKNASNKTIWIILPLVLFCLLSCASTQQEKTGSRDAEFYNNRGIAYDKEGQYDQAILDYNKALEINPRYAEAYNNRGVIYRKKGQFDRALLDYNRALKINPRFAESYYGRGFCYYSQKQYDKSWEDVNKAQGLGLTIQPEFLNGLSKASGREK